MVRLTNFSLTYPNGEKVLKNNDLEIKEGEAVLLTGVSGSGKSSIISSINGIATRYNNCSYEGEVFIDGKNTKDMELTEISMLVSSVFQNPKTHFFNVDTTQELLFFLENIGLTRGEMEERMADMLKLFDIERLLNRSIFELSGGEKQILSIAASYLSGTKLVVLDEPSSNLDEKHTLIIKKMLKTMKEKGVTLVIAEHRIYYLMEIVDRVYYVKDGEIEESYQIEEFQKLSSEELFSMGIRNRMKEELTVPVLRAEKEISKGIRKKTKEKVKETIEGSGEEHFNEKRNHIEEESSEDIKKGQVKLVFHKDKKSLKEELQVSKSEEKVDLEVKYLSYRYPKTLKGIDVKNLRLNQGKIYGIIGENGVGKSTFIKNLIGVLRNKEEILLEGKKTKRKERLKKSALVMQDVNHQLFTESVEDEVTLEMENPNEERVDEVLKHLGLFSYKKKHPMSLSGGEKQRVAIASVILAEKSIICFDEPTSGMDYANMMEISRLLKRTVTADSIMLVISHDIPFLNRTADYVVDIREFLPKGL